ncbi:transcription repressor OFP2 [Ricinus communis]|uniref:Transcription repressor n=1 Tax=Ricinus communis TaxID=3988 RepID=B9RX10_RICCO|nr:transcription repressor OFP2 [Ricinus communis]EEF44039.1 hypothetical protein RCOM_0815310 [Ricinus communis]|eukprot:XP_002518279.1 transcription repressor OFP2 [Ricinus communis]
MGNYRFRLSDMIPNAWFYKLKDMSKGRNQCTSNSFKKKSSLAASQTPSIAQPRYTYYFTTRPSRADKFYTSPINQKSSDTRFPDSPRKSSRKRSKRKTIYKPSSKLVSSSSSPYFPDACSCQTTPNTAWTKSIDDQAHHSPDYSSSPFKSSSSEPDFLESLVYESVEEEEEEEEDNADDGLFPNCSFDQQLASCSSSCNCKVCSSTTDIIIDVNGESVKSNNKKIDGFDAVSEVELPPILTKPTNIDEMTRTKFRRRSSKLEELNSRSSLSLKIVKEERRVRTHKEQKKINSVTQRSSTSSNSVGIRLRTNSPRIASRKIQASCARKSMSRNKTLSESFAVVKSSTDPQKDFKDSMVEMIIENNIRASRDLEDLLACYLSLNSKEYHDLIVKAFEQIWFDMTDVRL